MQYPHLVTADDEQRDLKRWLIAHHTIVDTVLLDSGAILFRGFGVTTAEQFNDLVSVPLGQLMEYVEGASPRVALGGNVYTSTEYASNLTVSMHNELSYSHRWPSRLAFFCRATAQEGGQTPLADSRRVFDRIAAHAPLPAAVEYRRVMPATRGFGVPWPVVFATDDRARVESYCHDAGITFAWLPDNSLRTSQVRPTAVAHPQTGAKVWFNQAHQWHPSNSGADAESALRELFGSDLPMNAVLANGDEISPPTLDAIRSAYQEETVTFDWQAGDVLIIDNMLTAHGRTPFTGNREVLVAMGGPVDLAGEQRIPL